MSWLRVDDGFSRHPKVTALTMKDRWTWLDVLCYCARYNTGGWLPANIREHCAGATPKFLHECVRLELLDVEDAELRVHDWQTYAPKDPTAAERQAAWRAKQKRAVTRNGDVTDSVTEDSSTSRARGPSRPVPSTRAVDLVRDERPSDFTEPQLREIA